MKEVKWRRENQKIRVSIFVSFLALPFVVLFTTRSAWVFGMSKYRKRGFITIISPVTRGGIDGALKLFTLTEADFNAVINQNSWTFPVVIQMPPLPRFCDFLSLWLPHFFILLDIFLINFRPKDSERRLNIWILIDQREVLLSTWRQWSCSWNFIYFTYLIIF